MIGLPQFNVPPIDPKTGQWNRQWWLFFNQWFTQTVSNPTDFSVDGSVDDPTGADADISVLGKDVRSQATNLSLMLQEGQDAIAKARRELESAIIEQSTLIDVIRSMASQDAGNVAITGGTMGGVTLKGDQVIQAGNLQFDNAQNLIWKDASGTVRNVLRLDAADELYVINNAGGGITIQVGGSTVAHITASGITFNQALSCTSINTGGNTFHAGSTTVGNFGCNGAAAQSSVTADGTLTTVENALKACGIMS